MEDRARHLIRIAALALAVAAAVAGCGPGTRQAAVRRPAFLCVAAAAPAAGQAGAPARAMLSGMRRELAVAGGHAGGFRVRLCVIAAAEDANRDAAEPTTPSLRAFGGARRGAGFRAAGGTESQTTSAVASTTTTATELPAPILAAAAAARRSTVIAFAAAPSTGAEQEAAPILATAGIPQLASIPMPQASSTAHSATAQGEPGPVVRSVPSTTLFLVPSIATQAQAAEQILRADHGCTHVFVEPASGSGGQLAALLGANLVSAGIAVSSVKAADCSFVAAGRPILQFARTLELGAPAACTDAWATPLLTLASPPPDLAPGESPRTTSRLCFLPSGVTSRTTVADYGAATMQVVLDAVTRLGAHADSRSAMLAALTVTDLARTSIGAVAFTRGSIVARTFTVYSVTPAGRLVAAGTVSP